MSKEEHREWSMAIGRFQCIPPHKGHVKLIKKVLDEGKNVVVALREEDGTNKNPYDFLDRYFAFMEIFDDEFREGRFRVISIPDVTEVFCGRGVGWKYREIKLDEETEKVSGTEMRKKGRG